MQCENQELQERDARAKVLEGDPRLVFRLGRSLQGPINVWRGASSELSGVLDDLGFGGDLRHERPVGTTLLLPGT